MNQYLIENKAWLHRKDTPYVWQFEWDDNRRMAVYQARKHLYCIRYCRYIGFHIARQVIDAGGNPRGWVQDHKLARPREIEFEWGGRYIFP